MPIVIVILLILVATVMTVIFVVESQFHYASLCSLVLLVLVTWIGMATEKRTSYTKAVCDVRTDTELGVQYIVYNKRIINVTQQLGQLVDSTKFQVIVYRNDYSCGINFMNDFDKYTLKEMTDEY